MSYAPQKLLDLDRYLRSKRVPPVGIVGDEDHTYGYHLGDDRISDADDYSIQHSRDRAGLSNAASAFDIGNHGDLPDLTAWLVDQCRKRAPGTGDIREVIGPGSDGRAYRWARENGWQPQRRAKGDSHEWHTHISYYRDSERNDKVALFRTYYEGDDVSAEDVWTKDNLVSAPRVDGVGRPVPLDGSGRAKDNPYWTGGNALRNTFEVAAKARGEQLAQHEALMAALKAHSDMPGADFEQIKAAAKAGAQEALAAADIAVTWGPQGA